MDIGDVDRWVRAYRRAWESNVPEEIGALFAEEARYHPEPFAEPWVGRPAIVREWLGRRDERGDTTFRFEVVAICEAVAFVRGWTRYWTTPPREYSNLWVIRLDPQRRCLEFTEWWMRHSDGQGRVDAPRNVIEP